MQSAYLQNRTTVKVFRKIVNAVLRKNLLQYKSKSDKIAKQQNNDFVVVA